MFPTLSSISTTLALGLVICTGTGAIVTPPVVLHPNGDASKCIDVRGAVFENGTPVQMCVLVDISSS